MVQIVDLVNKGIKRVRAMYVRSHKETEYIKWKH